MTDIVERLNDSLSAGYSELRKEAVVEIMRLRAEIERMERQEPIAFARWSANGLSEEPEKLVVTHEPPGSHSRRMASWFPLYALPGAQPAPSIPGDVMRDAKRYRFLRAAKNIPISTEAARDPVVYDAAIDAAMLARAPEAKP